MNLSPAALTWPRVKLVSMEMGTRKGITFVARISRGRPPDFEDDVITLMIPNMAIRTAGSREGIDCSKGSTSSMMIHLSKDSTSFPRHIKQFTRTWNEIRDNRTGWTGCQLPTLKVIVSKQIFFIRGKIQYFIACRSIKCANDGIIAKHNSWIVGKAMNTA